jgi:hypothetical protein
MGSGPGWPEFQHSAEISYCKEWWWTNLLYINNVAGAQIGTASCVGWSWYAQLSEPVISLPKARQRLH